jgi:DNA-binding transcriptional LysR family regulator
MSRPDLNLLVALDALLSEGSVVGAARRMHLSAPAMSRTLTRIRDAIGDQILVRAGQHMVPTPRALALQAKVRAVVEQATDVFRDEDAADPASFVRSFTLNLRANDVLGALSVGLLASLRKQAPGVSFKFLAHQASEAEALRSGAIDMIVGGQLHEHDLGPEIKVQQLFSSRVVAIARRDHPIFEAPITPEQLVAFPHVRVDWDQSKPQNFIDDRLAELGLRRQVALVAPGYHAAMFSLVDSDLILTAPANVADNVSTLGLPLRSFALPVRTRVIEVAQAWHPRFDKDPAHRWLRQAVKSHCLARESALAPTA